MSDYPAPSDGSYAAPEDGGLPAPFPVPPPAPPPQAPPWANRRIIVAGAAAVLVPATWVTGTFTRG